MTNHFHLILWPHEVIAPVQNKIGQLFMAPPLRNVLG
jgi:hypothetical protein